MNSGHSLTELTLALIDEWEAQAVAARVEEGLARHNEPKVGPRRSRNLVLSLADERGDIVGGLLGKTYWNALHIELMWVAEEYRGRGYGRRLVEAAEAEGCARGAEIAYVTTFSFQAPMFYERLGFRKFGELNDLPKGASRIWYAKYIGALSHNI